MFRLLFILALLPPVSLAAGKPHIVLLLADDLGYGDVSAYHPGSKAPSQHIDRLARQGVRLTDAHAPAAVCVPTRYGLMTGRYPMRADLPWRQRAVIEEGRTTIASLLRDNGYRTAMVGKWHLGFEGGHERDSGYKNMRGGPVDRGFDSFFGMQASLDQPPYYYVRGRDAVAAPTEHVEASSTPGWSPIQGAFWRAGGVAPGFKHTDVMPRFTQEAENVIAAHDPAKPLFLYLAYPAPHTPWVPQPEFQGRGEAGLYGEYLLQVDASVGRVLDALESAGMADDTLVIFTSDNGPVWYESDTKRFGHSATGPLRGMKGDSWEGGHRVPFIARWPGKIEPGSVTGEVICFTDMLATFAAIVGADVPSGHGEDSFNILPALLGETNAGPLRPSSVYKNGEVIRIGDWKLITHLGSGGFSEPRREQPAPGGPRGQLYNMREDIGETVNLWSGRPEIVSKLTRELERLKSAGRSR